MDGKGGDPLMKNQKALRIIFGATTVFFSLWMLFTAYAQLSLPQVQQVFVHLGFPDYFRVELSVAKILGVLVLLLPAPPRAKEWAYAGFAITLISALIAHLSVGDGPAIFMWSVVAGVILALSYYFHRKLSVTP
jgi:predicted Abi (CAAX) family protease